MKRVALTAALVAAVVVWWGSLPPRRMLLRTDTSDGSVRGVMHIHSRLSDGRGSFDDIATAAARAGLRFVVVTDHGDGTRAPEPPSYRSGVLVIDGVEISTRGGHYLAVGLPRAPYPLGGDPYGVVEDVRRLGGVGIVSHPDSPKAELRWTAWDAPFDGVELINPDTSWRVHAFTRGAAAKWLLLDTLLAYPVRPAEAVSQVLTEDAALRARLQAVAGTRRIVMSAGADAHAMLALKDTEPGENHLALPIPSYESSFESLSVHLHPATPLTGDATTDAKTLIGALRAGRMYLAVAGWPGPPAFSFSATSARGAADMGDVLAPGGPVTLHVSSNAPAGYSTLVWRGEQVISERAEHTFTLDVSDAPGVYVVEVRKPNTDGMPAWITSNPIYVRSTADLGSAPAPVSTPEKGRPLFDGSTAAGWSHESDATSLAAVDAVEQVDGSRIRLRYGLSGGSAAGQYAAAAVATPEGVDGASAIAFTARADGPMRMSLQVRAEFLDGTSARWSRSVFVDASDRQHLVRFDDMTPVGTLVNGAPPLARVRAIMFVVDTTNTKPGSSGRLWLGKVRVLDR